MPDGPQLPRVSTSLSTYQQGFTFLIKPLALASLQVVKTSKRIGIMFHIMLFNNVSAPIRQLHRIYDEMNDALTYAEGYFQILDADDQTEASSKLGVSKLKGSFELVDVRLRSSLLVN